MAVKSFVLWRPLRNYNFHLLRRTLGGCATYHGDCIHPAAHSIHSREALGVATETNCMPCSTEGRHAGFLSSTGTTLDSTAAEENST